MPTRTTLIIALSFFFNLVASCASVGPHVSHKFPEVDIGRESIEPNVLRFDDAFTSTVWYGAENIGVASLRDILTASYRHVPDAFSGDQREELVCELFIENAVKTSIGKSYTMRPAKRGERQASSYYTDQYVLTHNKSGAGYLIHVDYRGEGQTVDPRVYSSDLSAESRAEAHGWIRSQAPGNPAEGLLLQALWEVDPFVFGKGSAEWARWMWTVADLVTLLAGEEYLLMPNLPTLHGFELGKPVALSKGPFTYWRLEELSTGRSWDILTQEWGYLRVRPSYHERDVEDEDNSS